MGGVIFFKRVSTLLQSDTLWTITTTKLSNIQHILILSSPLTEKSSAGRVHWQWVTKPTKITFNKARMHDILHVPPIFWSSISRQPLALFPATNKLLEAFPAEPSCWWKQLFLAVSKVKKMLQENGNFLLLSMHLFLFFKLYCLFKSPLLITRNCQQAWRIPTVDHNNLAPHTRGTFHPHQSILHHGKLFINVHTLSHCCYVS